MIAEAHYDPPTNTYLIYLRDGHYYQTYDGVIHAYEPGQETQPYLKLDSPIYEAIVRAIIGPTPSDDVLRDARQVRDRLLTLVEKDHARMEQQAQLMFDQLMRTSR